MDDRIWIMTVKDLIVRANPNIIVGTLLEILSDDQFVEDYQANLKPKESFDKFVEKKGKEYGLCEQ